MTRLELLTEELVANDVLHAILRASVEVGGGNPDVETDVRVALLEAASRRILADAIDEIDGQPARRADR